jgi:hypothetical protein
MDSILHQPPEDREPAPNRARFSWLRVLGTLFIITVILGLLSPIIPHGKMSADHTEAFNNIRVAGLTLSEFESIYGKFPDATTIEKVKAATGTQLELGSSSSNQIFRQLLANPAIAKSEKPFWCKTAWSKKKPDDIFTRDKALQPGEVGFAYIAGLSSADDPLTPIVVAPLIPGTTRFDPKVYGEKAIILRLDNSATPMQIRKDTGEVWLNGMNLFDPRQPFWKGKPPDIKWAENP